MRKRSLALFAVLLMSISTITGCSSTQESNNEQVEVETEKPQEETDKKQEKDTDSEVDNSGDEEIEDQKPEIEYKTFEFGSVKLEVPSTWSENPINEYDENHFSTSLDITIDPYHYQGMLLSYHGEGEEVFDEAYYLKQVPNKDTNIVSYKWENFKKYKAYHIFLEFTEDSGHDGIVEDFYFFPIANDTKYLSVAFAYLEENAEAYTEIFNHILESVDMEELINEYGPALETESDDEAADDGQNVEAKKEQADTFVSSGAPKALAGFLDFRGTGFTVTIPENKQSFSMPDMTEGSVSFSDETHEIQSCDATILYETEGKAIHQILVLAPDAGTVESDRFKELISTIIVQMGITDFEEASEMVDSAYEVGEPIVENNTYLQMNNTLDHGFLIKY